jgi:hypothetical protein
MLLELAFDIVAADMLTMMTVVVLSVVVSDCSIRTDTLGFHRQWETKHCPPRAWLSWSLDIVPLHRHSTLDLIDRIAILVHMYHIYTFPQSDPIKLESIDGMFLPSHPPKHTLPFCPSKS